MDNTLFHNNRQTLKEVTIIVWLIIGVFILFGLIKNNQDLGASLALAKDNVKIVSLEKVEIKEVDRGNIIDELVDEYATKFTKGPGGYSQMKATLHCLLYFETKHTAANGKGDNGLASGPLQFHQGTYVNFRKIMIKKGLTDHLGSRDNLEDAIETTAWALSDGRGKNWGPILRGECVNPK